MKKLIIVILAFSMLCLTACAPTSGSTSLSNSQTESSNVETSSSNSTTTSSASVSVSASTTKTSSATTSKQSSTSSASTSKSTSTSVATQDTLEVVRISTSSGKEVATKTTWENGNFASLKADGTNDLSSLKMTIRGRGNTTWTFAKKPYKIKLDSKKKVFSIGSGTEKNWNLLANMCDHADIRNQLGLTFADSLENIDFVPKYKQVELYLNNKYNGTYLLTECVEVSSNRVNIDDDNDYLFEITKNNNSTLDPTAVFFQDSLGTNYEIKSSNTDTTTIKNFVNSAMTAIKSKNRASVAQYIDIPSAIDAYIIEETLNNMDVGWDSFYFTKKAGSNETIHFGPVWDFDVSMGNGNDMSQYAEGFCACKTHATEATGENRQNDWFINLMQCDWFRAEVKTRWNSISTQLNALKANVSKFSNAQLTANKRNFDLWSKVENNKLVKINYENDAILACTTYEAQVEYVSNWLTTRINWLNTQFNSQSYLDGTLPTHADL